MLSHQKEYNIEIELKSEKILNFELLYNMLQKELQILWQYLNKHFMKNFIQSSCFLFVFLMLFAKKSGRELCFCIDYQALNAITIQLQNLLLIWQTRSEVWHANTIITRFVCKCRWQINHESISDSVIFRMIWKDITYFYKL